MLSEASKKRYSAFWQNEATDRFLVYLSAPDGSKSPAPDFSGLTEDEVNWKVRMDFEFRVLREKERILHTNYYCDGFPTVFTDFGPGSLAACIGGNFQVAKDTVWFDRNPIIKNWDSYPEIKIYRNSEMWQATDTYTKMLCESGKGIFYTSIADIGGTLDIAASLRGTSELLFDVYDNPEQVKELVKKIQPVWKEAFFHLKSITDSYQDGVTSWMPIWCEKAYFPLQCDFSAMLSADMFEEFVLPDLIYQTEYLDHSIYHLDGPGELQHVDHLLSIPRLNAIQWIPGAGNADVADECWFELYQKIQAGGKGLVLFVNRPELLENLLKHISPKGVYIYVTDTDDYTARQLKELVEKTKI